MRKYTVAPKEFISERFVMDYFDYTKKEAIQNYMEMFPQFKRSELEIY
jgi:hypothetical protein